jgi:hypothetical protein
MLRKLMVLAAMMLVMSLLAITPAFAQTTDDARGCQGQTFCVPVCHKESAEQPRFTLFIPRSAFEAHIGHGDIAGACPEEQPPTPPVPGVTPGVTPAQEEVAVPVIESEVEQEAESGDVNIGFRVSNTGDYASQCTPAMQFGNTGNFQNGSSFVQFGSGTNDGLRDRGFFGNHGFFDRGGIDDFEPEGIDVSFGGSQDVSCSNTIQQSSAASSN